MARWRSGTFGALAFAALVALAPAAGAQKLYKWTDEKGVVHYTDKAPDPGRAGTVLDTQGRPVSRIEGAATPEQAQEVHAFIRHCLAEADPEIAAGVHILYGGSMKRANAPELLAMPDVDGGLLGGASLNVDEFMAVAITAQRLAQEVTS